MRELKFRCYSNEEKSYIDVNRIGFTMVEDGQNVLTLCGEGGKYCFEQFTGVHDSTTWSELTEDERLSWNLSGNLPSQWKGKEIYEGDIVKIYENIFVVYYEPLLASVRLFRDLPQGTTGFSLSSGKNFVPYVSVKIIGNIHENKELLGISNE